MGRTLSQAALPRDASGHIDLPAVERTLAELAGSTASPRGSRVHSTVLLAQLNSLAEAGPASAPVKRNGHPLTAPSFQASTSPVRRATLTPPPQEEPAAPKASTPTDVRGIGRVVPAPVTLEDLLGSASSMAPPAVPSSPAPSEAPAIETAEETVAIEIDLGSLPPLEPGANGPSAVVQAEPVAVASVAPPPVAETPAPPPVAEPTVAPSVRAPAPSSVAPRPLFQPFGGSPSPRSSYGSIPALGSRPPAPLAAHEVAAVGAVFDEFLGSAPVESPPRAPTPSAPRAMPTPPSGPHRAPSMQVPVFRPLSAVAPRATLAPTVVPGEDDAIESVEVEVEEVEEIAAPQPSRAPMLSRPPALPPLPPKKR